MNRSSRISGYQKSNIFTMLALYRDRLILSRLISSFAEMTEISNAG